MTEPDPENTRGKLQLLGRDYGMYGAFAATGVGALAAASISVGSQPDSPANQFKFDEAVRNEDALCVIEAGEWAGYAVADAHYGPESSHVLIERLHKIWSKIRPTDPAHLGQMIEFLRQGEPMRTESETTLLVAVYDRQRREGFGVSFGDSTFAIVSPQRLPTALNMRDHRYVTPAERRSMLDGSVFTFRTSPGDMMLVFTDGVDECCYRQPDRSIQPQHIAAIAAKADFQPLQVVTDLSLAALEGVDGQPGGEDNVAIIAATS